MSSRNSIALNGNAHFSFFYMLSLLILKEVKITPKRPYLESSGIIMKLFR